MGREKRGRKRGHTEGRHRGRLRVNSPLVATNEPQPRKREKDRGRESGFSPMNCQLTG